MAKSFVEAISAAGLKTSQVKLACNIIALIELGKVKPGDGPTEVSEELHKSGFVPGATYQTVYGLKQVWPRVREALSEMNIPDIFARKSAVGLSAETLELLEKAFAQRQAEPPAHETGLEQAVRERNASGKPTKTK